VTCRGKYFDFYFVASAVPDIAAYATTVWPIHLCLWHVLCTRFFVEVLMEWLWKIENRLILDTFLTFSHDYAHAYSYVMIHYQFYMQLHCYCCCLVVVSSERVSSGWPSMRRRSWLLLPWHLSDLRSTVSGSLGLRYSGRLHFWLRLSLSLFAEPKLKLHAKVCT